MLYLNNFTLQNTPYSISDIPLTLACYKATCLECFSQVAKGPHVEFICVTMPSLENPLEKYGYGPGISMMMRNISQGLLIMFAYWREYLSY